MSIRTKLVACLALFVVVAVSAVGPVAASAGDGPATAPAASPGCYPKGSVTIAQDKAGRFFRSSGWYVVCVFKQGRPRKLSFNADRNGSLISQRAKVAGRYVALFFVGPRGFNGNPGRPPSSVRVIDMGTGHRAFSAIFDFAKGSLVLKPDGSVAWISSVRGVVGSPQPWQVNRHDSTGTAVVDSGSGIDPSSLAAAGSWLYWTDGGAPRSAPFR